MKTCKPLLLLLFLFIGRMSYGDIIPEHFHFVDKCVKITNVDDYPDISMLGYLRVVNGINHTYVISASECLTKEYKYNMLDLFAVKKSYLSGKDLTSIDWSKDNHAVKTNIPIECYAWPLPDSIHVSAIDEFYRIVGFKTDSVVLYKWKDIYKFNNGKADSINNYSFSGDSTKFSKTIYSSIITNRYDAPIMLFPNPVKKSINLKFDDYYYGVVSIKILTTDGKMVKSFFRNKLETKVDYSIPIDNMTNGTYLVKIVTGVTEEIKKIVVE